MSIIKPPLYFSLSIIGALCLNACTTTQAIKDGPPSRKVDISQIPRLKPHKLARSRSCNPSTYRVNGKQYKVLKTAKGYERRGIASWYGTKFHGHTTSTGETYDMFKFTAASRTLPIPTFARVTNVENGRSLVVKVNDRGPFAKNRIIDLSYAAAKRLGVIQKGTALVDVKAITFPQQQRYMQVGVFTKHANALALRSKLNHLLTEKVLIKTVDISHKLLYRVQVGPLAGQFESAKLQQLLQKLGLGRSIPIVS